MKHPFENLNEHEKVCVQLLYPFSGNIELDKAIEYKLRENSVNAVLSSPFLGSYYNGAGISQNIVFKSKEHMQKAVQAAIEIAEMSREISHDMFLEDKDDPDFPNL